MLTILAYAFGVMYTPGPVNLLGIHTGISGKTRGHVGFFSGIACAMFILFMALGFLGNTFINPMFVPYMSLLGCCYIIYIAWKVLKANVRVNSSLEDSSVLSIWDGFFMQLLNPKALLATIPIATIQFPAENIQGSGIVLWSMALSILAFGAPLSYSLVGRVIGKKLNNPIYFKIFNRAMSVLLISVALNIGYEYVYLNIYY
ncbi:LysE family translocator [Photobacterium minamisatsumaniensis]|uniref:LysE family translocator n=1 Tax=Photobacterium minamisatsumaniensis TaxID=2910233 RepID=UPI003D122ADA